MRSEGAESLRSGLRGATGPGSGPDEPRRARKARMIPVLPQRFPPGPGKKSSSPTEGSIRPISPHLDLYVSDGPCHGSQDFFSAPVQNRVARGRATSRPLFQRVRRGR